MRFPDVSPTREDGAFGRLHAPSFVFEFMRDEGLAALGFATVRTRKARRASGYAMAWSEDKRSSFWRRRP